MIANLELTNEYALQRGIERQVLTLLHRVRNRRALAAVPLMQSVCAEMGTPDPVAALERIVRTVFSGDDESATQLRKAILDADFDRAATNAELARQTGISQRQFQRRRAVAVSAIAHYARMILGRAQDGAPLRCHRARCEPSSRFEREHAAFLRARDRGVALEMRAIAGSMLRLAESTAAHSLALAYRTETNVRLGKRNEAIEQLSRLSLSTRLLCHAELALLSGDMAGARANAQEALRAASADRERFRCLVLLSQAAAFSSVGCRLPDVRRLPLCSWERAAIETAQARFLVDQRKWEAAEKLARSALRRAELLGYQEPAARSAAVLHAISAAHGDKSAALRWRARAVQFLLPTQDRIAASGLFLGNAYGQWWQMDDLLNAALYERLRVVVPQMHAESARQRDAVCALLAAILDSAAMVCGDSAELARAILLVVRSDSALAHYAEKSREAICEMLALAVTALTGLPWNDAFERIREILDARMMELRPGMQREIAV